jgi:sn-glycerol 3-phosphate transport system substrate-binding protein
MKARFGTVILALGALRATPAAAQTEIHWWHAFTGRLGELLNEQVEKFNASQDQYTVVVSHKGNYSETLNAGIAASRAVEQPHILKVFEVGTATMMAAEGAVKPVYTLMAETGKPFDPDAYIASVKGYYTTPEGEMLSLPYNSSTPVLYVNRDAFEAAGVDPDTDLTTWEQVADVLQQLKEGGEDCPLVTAWQSWVHLENLSAWHDVAFATQQNGFAGLDAELVFDGDVQVSHIAAMGEWAAEEKFVYTGRRNEGGANFRGGECALFTESSAGYAGVKAEADFDFEIRPLPYWDAVEGAPQNTIIGGASLWVFEGHTDDEYAGFGLSWFEPVGLNGFVTVPDGFAGSREFCRRFVEEESVVLAPGDCFGYDDFFRIGFGLPPGALEEGLSRLGPFLDLHAHG